MVSPLEFMLQYRALRVPTAVEDTGFSCIQASVEVQLRNYFMMSWNHGSEEYRDYTSVTSGGSRSNPWWQIHGAAVRKAAMGKGSPRDYELALEWAVRTRRIPNPSQSNVQRYCDEHLGIDCSGFVGAWLAANGRSVGSNAASYYDPSRAVNDPLLVQQGDLLVWMNGNTVKTNPGHVALVESYDPTSRPGGNINVCEATGASGAQPKLLDSWYQVTEVIPPVHSVPMILIVTRFNVPGSRVVVIRRL